MLFFSLKLILFSIRPSDFGIGRVMRRLKFKRRRVSLGEFGPFNVKAVGSPSLLLIKCTNVSTLLL
jgi:hypothetical protein